MNEGWLANLEGYKELLTELFHHICLPNKE
jgi:hypothetical protein